MKAALVKFGNGDQFTTSINGTDEQIKDYYKIGRFFNLGDGKGGDNLQPVVSCEVLNENQNESSIFNKQKTSVK